MSGQIVIQDEEKDGVRHILAGSLTNDGFLMLDRIEDKNGERTFKAGITLNKEEGEEFYKQLKELMEDV